MRARIRTLAPALKTIDLRRASSLPETAGRSEKARKVYNSRRWRDKVRPDKLRRDPLCQACAYAALVEQASEVDHWVAIERGGDPWADGNLVSLCKPHHSTKTRCEQTGEPFPRIVASALRTYTLA